MAVAAPLIVPLLTTALGAGISAATRPKGGGGAAPIPQQVAQPPGASQFRRLNKMAGPWEPWDPADLPMMDTVSKGRPSGTARENPVGDTWQPWDPSSLAQTVSRPNNYRPPLAETPASVMAAITGPQMTVDPSPQANPPNAFSPGGAFGPPLPYSPGPVAGFSGGASGATPPIASSTPPVDESADYGKWFKAGGAGLASLSEIDQVQQRSPGVQQIGGKAPDIDRYKSGHAKAQADFAASVMERYLRGGGYA